MLRLIPPFLIIEKVELDLLLVLLRLLFLVLILRRRNSSFQIFAAGRPAPDSFEGNREDEDLVVEDLHMRVGNEILCRIGLLVPLEL